ncbi:MAG: hypothetical protein ABRQ39_13695 [Candidatus Eremiobacterota bacterium]
MFTAGVDTYYVDDRDIIPLLIDAVEIKIKEEEQIHEDDEVNLI